jgi:hypothetical protein
MFYYSCLPNSESMETSKMSAICTKFSRVGWLVPFSYRIYEGCVIPNFSAELWEKFGWELMSSKEIFNRENQRY